MLVEDEYLIFNEIDNAINSMIVAQEFIEKQELLKWKWVAIAIHHSLYSFCIAALDNCNTQNVVCSNNQNDVKEWITKDEIKWKRQTKKRYENRPYYKLVWLDCDEIPSKIPLIENKGKQEKLIGFWTALARVMDGVYWMGRKYFTKPLILNEDELEKIYWVTQHVRNEFVHFIPKSLILSIEDLKECLKIMVNSIEFLVNESNSIVLLVNNPNPLINLSINKLKENLEL